MASLIAWSTGLVPLAPSASPARVDADEALWRRLKGGGQVVLLRHATTEPRVGDVAGFQGGPMTRERP